MTIITKQLHTCESKYLPPTYNYIASTHWAKALEHTLAMYAALDSSSKV